jgi:hypothetical protein
MRKLLVISLICLFVGQYAYATNKDFYSNGTIQDGNTWMNVSIYDTPPAHTTVNMTGGSVTDVMKVYDASTLNMSAGLVRGALWANDQSTVNISGGSVRNLSAGDNATVNFSGNASADASAGGFGIFNVYGGTIYQLTGYDSAVINLYGGAITYDIGVEPSVAINVFGYDLAKTDTGGRFGYGQITGFWQDSSPFTINLMGSGAYSVTNLIPEPATFFLLGLGVFLFRKSHK